MELVRAAALTGYFTVAEELQLETLPLLRQVTGLVAVDAQTIPEQMLPARSVIRLLEESAEPLRVASPSASGWPSVGASPTSAWSAC